MATVRCRNCRNLVAFRGNTATCPGCQNGLRIAAPGDFLEPGESADASLGPTEPTLVAEYGRGGGTSIEAARTNSPLLMLVVAGVVLMVVLGLGLGVVWFLLNRPPAAPVAPVVVTPAAPATPATPPAPATVPAAPPTSAPAPTPPPATTRAVVTEPVWNVIRPQTPRPDLRGAVTDAKLDVAIRKAVNFLLEEFDGPALKNIPETEQRGSGRNAIAVYALLAAGKDLQDQRLDVRSPAMRARLDRVKATSPAGTWEVYTRSLRIQCLAYANRLEDRGTIEADLRWFLKANAQGAFTYREATAEQAKEGPAGGWWDQSCSQYGLLGVWAASMASVETPSTFWTNVENLWIANQDLRTGGWTYGRGGSPRTSMTCAGVNALVVAGDQLGLVGAGSKNRDLAASRTAIQRGLEYLAKENRIAEFGRDPYGYTAYGIERVGLATGYKYIGEVDWYKTVGAQLLRDQKPDGSWAGTHEADSAVVETSFCLLFLVRGRPPVMMAKLKYELPEPPADSKAAEPRTRIAAPVNAAPWHKFPRDLANLTHYASQKTERPLNWQIVDQKHSWREWLDSPVLMISGATPPLLTDEEFENLRRYVENGGVVFTHADGGSEQFTKFATDLSARLVPGGTLATLPPEHPIYSMVFKPSPAPPLQGVSNGNRLVLIHSPTEITSRWQRRVPAASQQQLETGLNLFVYAAGRGVGRNRTDSPVLPEPQDIPVGTITLARIQGPAGWDVEPAAWARAARDFELATRVRVEPKVVSATALYSPIEIPIAVLAVPEAGLKLSDDEMGSLRRWVRAGGTLVVDSVGGGKGAVASSTQVLAALLGSTPVGPPLTPADALLTGAGYGSYAIDATKVRVTDFTLGEKGGRLPAPRATRFGKGLVLSSELDLTTALLDCNVWGISGYTPAWSMAFTRNLLLSIAAGTPGQAGGEPASATP